MWKAVIPKLCSFWIKTPFFYYQTFASRILPTGWWWAAGPHLLLFSNSNGNSGGILAACGWLTQSGTVGFPSLQEFFCMSTQGVATQTHLAGRKGNRPGKRPWNKVQVRTALGKPLCGDHGLWDWLADLFVGTLWNNGVLDTGFLYMLSGFLDFSSYTFWPVCPGQ